MNYPHSWVAPSGVRVESQVPYVPQGGFWVHWKHYFKMMAVLQGWKWAYDPSTDRASGKH